MVAFHARPVSFLHLFSSSASLRLNTTIHYEKKSLKWDPRQPDSIFYRQSTDLYLNYNMVLVRPFSFLSFFHPSLVVRARHLIGLPFFLFFLLLEDVHPPTIPPFA